MSYEFIGLLNNKQDPSSLLVFNLSFMLARLSTILMPIAGAWFCAGQYTKLKNIAEDYAYKTMLAQSIIGFSEQLKYGNDKESYKTYIKRDLCIIHNSPP